MDLYFEAARVIWLSISVLCFVAAYGEYLLIRG